MEAAKHNKKCSTQDQRRILKNVFLTHRQMGIFEAFMKIFPAMKMKDSNIGVEYVPLGKPQEISRYLVRADEGKEYFDKELFPIKDREGLYYEKPNVIDKYIRRGELLENICLAQFVKMYDPVKSEGKSCKEMKKDGESDSDENNMEDANGTENHENLEELYGNDAKFHCLIKHDGTLGRMLPSHIKLLNPLPNEPPFMKKRNSPKALRFYKPKCDTNPGKYFLQELLLYKKFDQKLYECWTSREEYCTEYYYEEMENIRKVKEKVMEWLEDIEEARMYVEETLMNEAETEETGKDMDAEKEQEIDDCEEEGVDEDPQYCHLNPDGFLQNPCESNMGVKKMHQLLVMEIGILEEKTQKLDEWQRKVVDIGMKFARDIVKARKSPNTIPKCPKTCGHWWCRCREVYSDRSTLPVDT